MKSGDTKRGAGLTVYLLPDSTTGRAQIGDVCAAQKVRDKVLVDSGTVALAALNAENDALHAALLRDILSDRKREAWDKSNDQIIQSITDVGKLQKVVQDSTVARVRRLLVGMAIDSTSSGMNAHYKFAIREPGPYLVFSEWPIGEYDYQWLVPVRVAKGDSVRADLDTSHEASDQVYCGLR